MVTANKIFYMLTSCLFFIQSIDAQKLPRGTFKMNTGFVSESFSFHNKSKFSYQYNSCTGSNKGSGIYTFNDHILTLTFIDPKKLPPYRQSVARTATSGDSTEIDLSIFNLEDSAAVAGAAVSLTDSLHKSIATTFSNQSGFVKLVFSNRHLPVDINIQFIGAHNKKFRLYSAGTYQIKLPVSFAFENTYVKGDVLQFEIAGFDETKLSLKPVGEKEFIIFTLN